jgi:ribosomal-protein-serine acetyltransferase
VGLFKAERSFLYFGYDRGGDTMFKCEVDEHIYLAITEMRHAEALYNVIAENRDHIGQFLMFARTQTSEDTKSFVQTSLNKFSAGTDVPTCIWYDKQLIGSIGLHISEAHRSASIGYWISKEYEGRGIVTKCCEAMIDYAFRELKLNRVEIRAINENLRSRAIPERLGFKHEGTFRQDVKLYDQFADSIVYGLLAEEWRSGN